MYIAAMDIIPLKKAIKNHKNIYVLLIVSYIFRKNIQRKIKMDNVLRGVGGKAISIER